MAPSTTWSIPALEPQRVILPDMLRRAKSGTCHAPHSLLVCAATVRVAQTCHMQALGSATQFSFVAHFQCLLVNQVQACIGAMPSWIRAELVASAVRKSDFAFRKCVFGFLHRKECLKSGVLPRTVIALLLAHLPVTASAPGSSSFHSGDGRGVSVVAHGTMTSRCAWAVLASPISASPRLWATCFCLSMRLRT
eukprot:scaffold712_cov404-Prasinococcus_capsulatus_cf.AAC.6